MARLTPSEPRPEPSTRVNFPALNDQNTLNTSNENLNNAVFTRQASGRPSTASASFTTPSHAGRRPPFRPPSFISSGPPNGHSVPIPVHSRPAVTSVNAQFAPLARLSRPAPPSLSGQPVALPVTTANSALFSTPMRRSKLVDVHAMDGSPEMTQVNERDYSEALDSGTSMRIQETPVQETPLPWAGKSFGPTEFGPDFGDINDPLSDPMSPMVDTGALLRRGDWRAIQSSPRGTPMKSNNPFRRNQFPEPTTPAANNNPFAQMNFEQSEMRPSQLFLASEPQLPDGPQSPVDELEDRPSPGGMGFGDSPMATMPMSSPTQNIRRHSDGHKMNLLGSSPTPIPRVGSVIDDDGPLDFPVGSIPLDQAAMLDSLEVKRKEGRKLKRKSVSMSMTSDDETLDFDSLKTRDFFGHKRAKHGRPATSFGAEGSHALRASTSLQSFNKLGGQTHRSGPIVPRSQDIGVVANSQTVPSVPGSDIVIQASRDTPDPGLVLSEGNTDKDAVPDTSLPSTQQSKRSISVVVTDAPGEQGEEEDESTILALDGRMESEQQKMASEKQQLDSDDQPLFQTIRFPLGNVPLKSPTIEPLSQQVDLPDTMVIDTIPILPELRNETPQKSPSPRRDSISSSLPDMETGRYDMSFSRKDTTAMDLSSEQGFDQDDDNIESPQVAPVSYTAGHVPRHITPIPPPHIPVGVLGTQINHLDIPQRRPARVRTKTEKLRQLESSVPPPSVRSCATDGSPPRLHARRPKGRANRIISETPDDTASDSASVLDRSVKNAARLKVESDAASRESTPLSEAPESVRSGTVSPIRKKKVTKSRPQALLKKKLPRKSAATVDSSEDELSMNPADLTPTPPPVSAGLPTPNTAQASIKKVKGWEYIPVAPDNNLLFKNMLFALSFQSKELVQPPQAYEERQKISAAMEQKILAAGGSMLSSGFEELFVKTPIASSENGISANSIPTLELTSVGRAGGFTIVIADGHSRKVKYMQALALGIPCVAYHWVDACLKMGMLVPWAPYLLSAGASIIFCNAMMSRSLPAWPPGSTSLQAMIGGRLSFLSGHRILFVMKRSREEDKKKFYLFLMHVLGAVVSRAFSVTEARAMLFTAVTAKSPYHWVYMGDGGPDEPEPAAVPAGGRAARGKARRKKRDSRKGDEDETFAGVTTGLEEMPRAMTNEFLVQSLIRGDLIEADVWDSVRR